MKSRPWIWIIVAYAAFVTGLTTMVVTAVRNKQPEVPLTHGR
jgi:hypothetical protein